MKKKLTLNKEIITPLDEKEMGQKEGGIALSTFINCTGRQCKWGKPRPDPPPKDATTTKPQGDDKVTPQNSSWCGDDAVDKENCKSNGVIFKGVNGQFYGDATIYPNDNVARALMATRNCYGLED